MSTKFGVDSSSRQFPFRAWTQTHTVRSSDAHIHKVTNVTDHPNHASATVGDCMGNKFT